MLELYHNDISVCAQKVRIVLAEKGLDWISHHINLVAGEQTAPEYLAIHPKAVVPALIDDGQPVLESTLICEYLDENFPRRRCGRTIWWNGRRCGAGRVSPTKAFTSPALRSLLPRFSPNSSAPDLTTKRASSNAWQQCPIRHAPNAS